MTLRFAKIYLSIVGAAVLAIGSAGQAQENVSGNENSDRANSENVIEVKVDSLQAEEVRKFLQEHRAVVRQSKSDLSGVVEKFRADFKNIKQEQTRTLKEIRKYKPPTVVIRKTASIKKKISRLPESSTHSERNFPDQNFFEPSNLHPKETLLSLNERQRRADIASVRLEKFLRAQNTEWGRLQREMAVEPLKSYQGKLEQFSDKIKKLMKQLKGRQGVQPTVFLDLGNSYLESQSYLNALNAKDRSKLARYASHAGTILGSHESALWVLKMALVRNPKDGETNLLLGKILSETGERDLALRRARNAERLFVKNRQPDKAVQTRSFIESLKSSSAQK